MKTAQVGFFIALLQTLGVTCFAEAANVEFRVLRNGVINDTVAGAIAPSGIATTRSGKWLLAFLDKGDCTSGCKVYCIESRDAGQTWSQPYKIIEPENALQGIYMPLFSLDDGCILGAKTVFTHEDNAFERRGFRTSKIMMMASQDEGRSFTLLQEVKTPGHSIVACMNTLVKLKSGDLILPAYCSPTAGTANQPGAVYGSGFFRSRDGGKTWGEFERAFKEVPATKALGFNESAFAVKDDGTIVGFARIDSRPPTNNMWKVTSRDNGKTWSMPEETNIRGNFPEIKRLNNSLYVMVCGLRIPGDRPTTLFVSADGENYEQVGTVYYSRPEHNGGRPWGSGCGGTQSIIPVGENRAYVVYYGSDLGLKGSTYIDGCLIEFRRRSETNDDPGEARPVSVTRLQPAPLQTVDLSDDAKLELIHVEPNTPTNAAPVKAVVLRHGFYLGKYEITQAQYLAVMNTNPACFKGDNLPVENVSWHDALAFCERLTRIERHAGRLSDGEVYRLPTEAEWEFAAQGGNRSRNSEFSGYHNRKWPDEFTAWYCSNSSHTTHEVGQRGANELGFHDMSGNVWEWTDDCYSDIPAYAGGGHYAREMAIRGGAWNALGGCCKVTSRSNFAPLRRMNSLGFRVLKTVSE